MAEKIIIEIDLEKGDVTKATKQLEKSAIKSGAKAAKGFAKKFGAGLSKSFGNIGKAAGKATLAIGGVASALIAFQSIKAAQVQEDAINALNSALSISKNSSVEASKGLQAFASGLQQVTRFGDEVLLKNMALIQSLGDLDAKGLKAATIATTDLAAALKIDLGSAATLVGKAAAGEVGSFSRFGLVIKKGANNAETLARALDGIKSKFGGAAERDVKTYSGAVEQMTNAYGDVLEEIGRFVTDNPKMVKSIKSATNLFVNLGNEIIELRGKIDLFQFATNAIEKMANTVLMASKAFEFMKNLGDLTFKILASGINTTISAFATMGSVIAKVLETVGIENSATAAIQKFSDEADLAAQHGAQKVRDSFTGMLDFPMSERLEKKNEDLRTFFAEQNAIVAEQQALQSETSNAVIENAKVNAMTIGEVYGSVFDGMTSGLDNVGKTVESANEMIKKFSEKSGKALQQGFAKGAASAFAAFGAAVANGEDALGAFGKALLKSIASQAISLGTNFMLQGAAMLFSPDPTLNAKGGPLIANGAALAAFGGALGASSGGGAGASSGGSSSASASAATTDSTATEEIASPDVRTTAKEQVSLSINIEGSFVRESELNGYISDILETGSSRDATIIPSLSTGLS